MGVPGESKPEKMMMQQRKIGKDAVLNTFFVYGTLKRGQCRSALWPCPPVTVRPAWTRGHLYGRHDYPAMTAGDDAVMGECWEFADVDVPAVITALDAIEGTNQPGEPDLYHRVITEVFDAPGRPIGNAYTYHYATDPADDGFRRVQADEFASWP